MTLAAFALAAALQLQSPLTPPQAPAAVTHGTARIIGRVVAADTGAVVRGATVLVQADTLATVTATTDGDGRFDVPRLGAGRYRIRVSKSGFVTTSFGAATAKAGGLVLAAGQSLDRGDLALPRGGVLTGRVFDEFGDPVAGVSVQALRSSYINPGNRRLATEAATETNDLGEFRIFGLRPGQYFIAASLRRMQLAVADAGAPAARFAASTQGSAPTFYPGTSNGSEATAVAVVAGRETSGLDLRLLAVPLARVSGTVVDASGRPPSGMFVWLNPSRSDGAVFSSAMIADLDALGRFSVPNVAPGDYRIDVESRARMEAMARTGSTGIGQDFSGPDHQSASVPVSVNGQDVDGVTIQIGRAARLSGKVTVDGMPPAAEDVSRATVTVTSTYPGLSATLNAASARVNPDGTFAVTSAAGIRMLRVHGLPDSLFLKSIRARGVDVTDEGLDVDREDVPDVEIDLTVKPTRVVGTAKDAEGAPLRQFSVIVFPENSRLWTVMMNRVVVAQAASADGTFSVVGLPAGRYFAAAVESLVDGEWAEPANLEKLRATATSFKLGDGEHKELTLTAKRQD